MTTIKLYGDADYESPYVFSVHVALREKGLPFEYVPVDLSRKQQSAAEFVGISLTRKVPALTHGSLHLSESLAIVEYLEEAFPDAPSVLPRGIEQRGRARQLMSWLRTDLLSLREERPSDTIFHARAVPPLSPPAAAAARKLVELAGRVLMGPLLFERFCLADADLAFMLERLIANGDDVPARLRDFAASVWKRPSVAEVVALATARPV